MRPAPPIGEAQQDAGSRVSQMPFPVAGSKQYATPSRFTEYPSPSYTKGDPKDDVASADRQATRSLPSIRSPACEALSLDPDEPHAHLGLAQFYLSRNQAKQALPHARAARARLGDVPSVLRVVYEAEG